MWTVSAGNACVAGGLSPMIAAGKDGSLDNLIAVQATNSDETLASAFQPKPFSLKHLLGIEGISTADLTHLLDRADQI